MSAVEFLSLGETSDRLELIDGVVVVSPSPLPRHQRVVQELFRQIDRQCVALGTAEVYLDADVRFGEAVVFRPDLSVFATGRLPPDPDSLAIAPDLVIEVLSPSSRSLDLVAKRDHYERNGVAEYIVVDADSGRVQRWCRKGARFVETPVTGDSLVSRAFASLTLDLERVRRAARPR
jgi:Uma2 family endonuclease